MEVEDASMGRENLFSKNQLVPSKQYKERYDEIKWNEEGKEEGGKKSSV